MHLRRFERAVHHNIDQLVRDNDNLDNFLAVQKWLDLLGRESAPVQGNPDFRAPDLYAFHMTKSLALLAANEGD